MNDQPRLLKVLREEYAVFCDFKACDLHNVWKVCRARRAISSCYAVPILRVSVSCIERRVAARDFQIGGARLCMELRSLSGRRWLVRKSWLAELPHEMAEIRVSR